jgi:hypothetical protein
MAEIKLIQLSNYVRPDVVENTSMDWVLNGRNNSFYQYIIDRHNGSVTNASINNSYIDLIYGRGLGFTNGARGVMDWAKLQTILRPKELRKIISDFQIFGEFSMQVIKTKGGDLSSIEHIAKQSIVPSIQNEDGEIEHYWFSRDWAKWQRNKPVEFPAFGTSKDAIEIYCGKPYKVGKVYFSDPDYIGAMPFMEMEEEIANGNISYIKNGLSAGYVINIPDGMSLTPEQKDKIEKDIRRKLTGSSNSGTFILNFSGRDQEPITVTVFPVADNIHKQWQWLSEEATQKILTSHRATSPALVGIVSSSGFSNTADEMDMAEQQLLKRVIKPKQDFVLDALEDVLLAYGISLDLYFKPLTEIVDEPVEEPTRLSNHCNCNSDSSDDEMFKILDSYALDMSADYDLTDGTEYELQLSANQTSEQDSALWKIRYAYTKGTSKSPKGSSRAFCNRMVSLGLSGKVYRKEDIELMSSQGVNGQFAHSGGKYDIFLYAGGVNCYHRWERRIFKKKLNEDGTPKKGGAMATTTEVNVNEARRQGAKIPKNSPDVAIAEIDKPNNGRY